MCSEKYAYNLDIPRSILVYEEANADSKTNRSFA